MTEADTEIPQRKIRAFIALKTPALWDEKLGALQRDLKSQFGGGAFRWVKPEQIHITLRFFGWLNTTEADRLRPLLSELASAQRPFSLTCEGLGTFPNMRRPRVFWAGLKGDLERAASLQRKIIAASEAFGDPPEERPFKPHLTLARLKEPDRRHITDLEHAVSRGFQIDEVWGVSELLFMQSHLSPQGSTYETLARYPFGSR
jgi:RNA 2',3'-cyclic 3'-phosphodiesterase